MNIALIGATGFVGSAVLNELLQRGHRVTVLARNPAKLTAREGLTVVAADAQDATQVAKAVAGHDAVVSAYNPGWTVPDIHDQFLQGTRAIIDGTKQAGVRRLLAVIGDSANAGSIGVHRAAGFSDVGIMRSTGWKFGKWLDIVLMDKPIGAGDTTSPE